jgi:hypothetical protein
MSDRRRRMYTLIGMVSLLVAAPIAGLRYHVRSDRLQHGVRPTAVSAGRPVPVQPSYRPSRGQTRFVARALSVAYLRYADCLDDACRQRERAVIRRRLQELLEYERRDRRLRRLCHRLLARWNEPLLEELMSYLYESTRFGGNP